MNLVDRIVAWVSPSSAVARVKARRMLASYEAARPRKHIKNPFERRDANSVNAMAATTLRGQARYLDENYDFASGVLDVLVRNTVGANGIGVVPLPKNVEGSLDKELASRLRALWQDFIKKPEVTKQLNWAMACQLVARSLYRDGEVFSKSVMGRVAGLDHKTKVQYSLELLEADYCPNDHEDHTGRVIQGIKFNAWRQPLSYFFYDQHPGGTMFTTKLREVSSERVDHLKLMKRLHQARGISAFHAVINRLNAISEYENNEQVAAAVASALTAFIQKGDPGEWAQPTDDNGNPVDLKRDIRLQAGQFFELEPGEQVGTIQSNRPSGLLTDYHKIMMKGVSAGTGAGNSSTSKNYDGTYSAQRQELVEQAEQYKVLTGAIVSQWVRPVWKRFITMAALVEDINIDLTIDGIFDAAFMGPQMPWIDPAKEATAYEKLRALGVISPQQIIHARGHDPDEVLDQIEEWQKELTERGLSFQSNESPQPNQPNNPNNPDDTEE